MVMDFDQQTAVAMLEKFGQFRIDVASVERPWRDSWRKWSSWSRVVGQGGGHRAA
jgi:hypothetical protein